MRHARPDILAISQPGRALRRRAHRSRQSRDRHEGQGLVEYGLILLLISVAAAGSLGIFGTALAALYQTIVDGLPF